MPNTDMDIMTRARIAFQKQGDSELEAMGKARQYLKFYKGQKKRKGLFEDEKPSGVGAVRG